MLRYCPVPECERPSAGHGYDGMCASHLKQMQRRGRTTTISEKLSADDRLLIAASAWAEASAENDEEYEAARRAVLSAGIKLGNKALRAELAQLRAELERVRAQLHGPAEDHGAIVREGMARARERGVRFGRQPRVPDEELLRALAAVGGRVTAAAERIGLAHSTVSARLARLRRSGEPSRPAEAESQSTAA